MVRRAVALTPFSPLVLSCPAKPRAFLHGRSGSKGSYLAVLCQQLDVVLIDLLHLLQLATAQLPLDDVPVIDFGAQLPGQDCQGFTLWRQIIEDLGKGKAKRVLGRRNRETRQRDRAGVKAAVQGAQEDADFHGTEQMVRKEKPPGQSMDFSGCSAEGAVSLNLITW